MTCPGCGKDCPESWGACSDSCLFGSTPLGPTEAQIARWEREDAIDDWMRGDDGTDPERDDYCADDVTIH